MARVERDRPDALLVTGKVPMWKEGARVASFVERLRLPALYFHIHGPLSLGGLMSVAVDEDTAFQQVAAIVDRIFKGERPADIPVEPARRTALVVNLKAARMIGLTLPPSFLAKADEVLH